METVRYFKDLAKSQLRVRRSVGDNSLGLQQVQHQVAVSAGYRSWEALLGANERDRQLAVAMDMEPELNRNGFGAGAYGRSLEERRADARAWRVELRSRAERVDEVRQWLVDNIDPRQTINPDVGSYGLKHTAERILGEYVANGELIAAAIIAGYPYRREGGGSPNARFGMSSRSVAALRRAARV